MSIKVEEKITINAEQKKVFDLLWDTNTYPKVFSEIKEAKEKKKGKKKEATFKAELMGEICYTLLLEPHAPDKITWTLVEGDMMKSNTGAWILKNKKGKTELTYKMETELSIWVPNSIIERLLSKHLPDVLLRVKEEIEK